jgi:hypothetical protein
VDDDAIVIFVQGDACLAMGPGRIRDGFWPVALIAPAAAGGALVQISI